MHRSPMPSRMPLTSASTTVKAVLSAALVLLTLVACGKREEVEQQPVLAPSEETAKTAATVLSFVDGDTVRFQTEENGDMTVRFLAINTPESTGKIEEYGKAASEFTKNALSQATEILLESDDDGWNLDATGSRYLCWVWYRPKAGESYRNLNVELLEAGLARGSNAAGNRYGSFCTAALETAQQEKRKLYSGQPDPDFYQGEILEVTLQELRLNPAGYDGCKVAVTGIVIGNSGGNGIYLESAQGDARGFYVYYGHHLPAQALEAMQVGNEVRLVGTVQYYENGESWQLSGLTYSWTDPEAPENPRILSTGNAPGYPLRSWEELKDSGETLLCTSLEARGLTVTQVEGEQASCQWGETDVRLTLPEPETLAPGDTLDVRGILVSAGDAMKIQVTNMDDLTIY